MMEQLIKVSSVPFQAIRFTQNARLVPADNMALERQSPGASSCLPVAVPGRLWLCGL